jgi:hypothetical protein
MSVWFPEEMGREAQYVPEYAPELTIVNPPLEVKPPEPVTVVEAVVCEISTV